MEKKSQNLSIKEKAIETGKLLGFEYWIIEYNGSCNGYALFPKKPVRENNYSGILTYVPVHGGITYTEHDKLGSVYGFDTKHCDSHEFPINDKKWIKKQIRIMIKGILKAKEVETKYLKCFTNKGKLKYIQQVSQISPKQWNNFGTNLNLLTGKL